MNYKNFFLEWMNHQASSLQAPSSLELLTPAFLVTLVFVAAVGFVFFRRNTQQISIFNSFLIIAVLAGFQACGLQTDKGSRQALRGPVKATTPPIEDDDYFNNQDDPLPPPITLFAPRTPAVSNVAALRDYLENQEQGASGSSAVITTTASNLKNTMVAECLQYNAIKGTPVRNSNSCIWKETWAEIKPVLNECRTADSKIVMDLSTTASIGLGSGSDGRPLIQVRHGHPFPAYVFCVRPDRVEVLNPEHLSYEMLTDAGNIYTYLTRVVDRPGWFQAAFDDYENGRVSSKGTVIKLAAQQGDANPLPIGLQAGVRVVVFPEGRNAQMKEFKMMTTLTDLGQEPLRGPSRVAGLVSPAYGEVILSDTDVIANPSELSVPMQVERTYRSFNNQYGDFGKHWAWIPRKHTYEFVSPTGALGEYDFLETGEGRLVSVGTRADRESALGPFWDNDDPKKPDINKLFYFWNLDNSHFDLGGRLVGHYDHLTGNMLYYIYHGSGVEMIASTEAVRAGVVGGIINSMRAALVTVDRRAPSPGQVSKSWIAQYVAKQPGDVIYFLRNTKGYIVAAIEKSGNFTWYWYGRPDGTVDNQGDYLVKVERFVRHNPNGTGAVDQSFVLAEYKYDAKIDGSSPEEDWRGLLKEYKHYSRPTPVYKEIKYKRDNTRYADFPLADTFENGGVSYELKYDFSALDSEEPSSKTEVIDELTGESAKQIMTFNEMGIPVKIEGPSETANSSLILEARWNYKLQRVVNVIKRGVEEIFEYNSSTGLLKSHSLCADRDASGSRVEASLEGDDLGGSCEGEARKTEYTVPSALYHIPDYIEDLTGAVSPLNKKLPTPTGTPFNGAARTVRHMSLGCGTPGGIFEFIDSENGSTCINVDDPRGGKYFTSAMSFEEFEDGSLKRSSEMNFHRALLAPWTPSETNHIPSEHWLQASHLGQIVEAPAAGWNSVYAPGGVQSLTGNIKSFYDPTGNILSTLHPWGVETHYYYDYRTPTPILVAKKVKGHKNYGSPVPEGLKGLSLIGAFGNARNAAGSTWPELVERKTKFFGPDAELDPMRAFQFVEDRVLNAQLKVERETLPSGEVLRYQYDPVSGMLKQIYRDSRAQYDSIAKVVEFGEIIYDDFERKTHEVSFSGVQTTIGYRTQYDRGPFKTMIDATAQGGVKETIEQIDFDWAGRPTEIKITRDIPSVNSKPVSYAAELEIHQITYSEFGEVKSTVKTYDSNKIVNESYEREPLTGTPISFTKSFSGNSLPSEASQVDYLNFNKYLRAQKISDVLKKVETTFSGIPGKDLETIVRAPGDYRTGEPSVIYSRQRLKHDGCENLVEDSKHNGSVWRTTTNSISYGDGLCVVQRQTDPTGWFKEYFYNSSMEPVGTDERRNAGALDVGHQASAVFSDQLVWHPRHASGRSNGPGVVVQFQMSGGPGYDERRPENGRQFWDMVYYGASYQETNSLGVGIKEYQFAGTSHRVFNRKSLNRNEVEEDRGVLGKIRYYNDLQLNSMTMLEDSDTVSATDQYSDFVLRTPRRSVTAKLNRQSSAWESRIEENTYDAFGRRISSSLFAGAGNDPSLKQMYEITSWNNGAPEVEIIQRYFTGGADTETRTHSNFVGELPAQVSISRSFGGREVSGTIHQSFDGLGQIKELTYSQTPHAEDGNVQLTTSSVLERDALQRITRETITMDDTVSGQYQLGGIEAVARDVFSTPQALNIQYQYLSNGSVIMSYEGFQVQYNLSRGKEGLVSIDVTIPGGGTAHYAALTNYRNSPSERDRYYDMPFVGNMDTKASSVERDEDPWWAFGDWLFEPSGEYRLKTFNEIPTWVDYGSDPRLDQYFRDVFLDLNDETHLINEITTSYDASFLRGTNNRVFHTESTFAADSSRYQACDRLRPGYATISSTDSVFSNSRLVDVVGDDNQTRFNELGKVSYATRKHYAYRGDNERQISWRLESKHSYDHRGMPAASEEIIHYRNLASRYDDDSNGSYEIVDTFWSERPMRIVLSRSFYAENVFGGLVGGGEPLFLVEHVKDPGSGSRLVTDQRSQPDIWESPTPSREGKWVYIYGPNTAPVMAFHTTNGTSWTRYDFVVDSMGNVKYFYPFSRAREPLTNFRDAPELERIYYPFLTYANLEIPNSYNEVDANGDLEKIVGPFVRTGYGAPLRWYHSHDPSKLPDFSRFAGSGFRQDITGFLYPGGNAYDPYTARTLSIEDDQNLVCRSGGLVHEKALAMASEKRDQKAGLVIEGSFSPSLKYELDLAQAHIEAEDRALKNMTWFGQANFWLQKQLRGSNISPMSVNSTKAFFQSRGAEWYYKNHNLDGSIEEISKAAEWVSIAAATVATAGTAAIAMRGASIGARAAAAARAGAVEFAEQMSPVPVPGLGKLKFTPLTINRLDPALAKGTRVQMDEAENFIYIRQVGEPRKTVFAGQLDKDGRPYEAFDTDFEVEMLVQGSSKKFLISEWYVPGLKSGNYRLKGHQNDQEGYFFFTKQGDNLSPGGVQGVPGNRGVGKALKAVMLDRHMKHAGARTHGSQMAETNEAAFKSVFFGEDFPADATFRTIPALQFRGYDFELEAIHDGTALSLVLIKKDGFGPAKWLNRDYFMNPANANQRQYKQFKSWLERIRNP